MGLVLEEEQPVFILPVYVDLHLDGAGVDLLRLVKVGEDAVRFELFGADDGDIHQGHRFAPAGIELGTDAAVFVVGRLDRRVLDFDPVDDGAEGGVAAVVGPVGVDQPDFGDGGVTVLHHLEIGLAEGDVVKVHREAVVDDKAGQLFLRQAGKAVEGLDGGGDVVAGGKGRKLLEGSFPRFDRVDEGVLDGGKLLVRNLPFDQVDAGAADLRPVALGHDLDALFAGIRPLVKLAGEVFDSEQPLIGGEGGEFGGGEVDRRFREDGPGSGLEGCLVDPFDIVAVEEADLFDLDAEGFDVAADAVRFDGKRRLLFDIDSENSHFVNSFLLRVHLNIP